MRQLTITLFALSLLAAACSSGSPIDDANDAVADSSTTTADPDGAGDETTTTAASPIGTAPVRCSMTIRPTSGHRRRASAAISASRGTACSS